MANRRALTFSAIILTILLVQINAGCSSGKYTYNAPPEKYTLIKNDTLIEFYTSTTSDKAALKLSEAKHYTWYRTDSIYVTQGAIAGKLLHGSYMELYPNRSLKMKGRYKNGLKDGKWQSWYQNGEIRSSAIWKEGVIVSDSLVIGN